MGRVETQIKALQNAKSDILDLLKKGPLTTGDLMDQLNYNLINFYITQGIGDHNSDWDKGPHIIALSDLLDDGVVEWWRDINLDVWDGLNGSKPDQTGEDYLAEFFKEIIHRTGFAADPSKNIPCELTKGEQQVALEIDRGKLEVYAEYDCDYKEAHFDWPVTDYETVAAKIIEFGEWSEEKCKADDPRNS